MLAVRIADRLGKGVRTAPRDALLSESVAPHERGLAFGLHRSGDTAGAFVGLVIAFGVVWWSQRNDLALEPATFRTLVLASIIPAVLAVLVLALGAKDIPVERQKRSASNATRLSFAAIEPRFGRFLVAVVLFTLGNSTDAFLILRAQERGLSVLGVLGMLAGFNLVYALVSTPAGKLSARSRGRPHFVQKARVADLRKKSSRARWLRRARWLQLATLCYSPLMKRLALVAAFVFGGVGITTAEIAEKELVLEDRHLHYLEAGERGQPTVLLLHGARFTSETWRELGTIDLLAGAGFHVVALDLPGFGRSQSVEIDRQDLLVTILDALAIDSAVVVSPSMSGQFSFPLVTRSTDRVSGFVPIAPGGIDDYARTLRKVRVPTLIFWGEKDEIIPVAKSDELAAAIADSRRVILKGASHPCYLDRPEEFHRELMAFARSLGAR